MTCNELDRDLESIELKAAVHASACHITRQGLPLMFGTHRDQVTKTARKCSTVGNARKGLH
jgi:hypothetical protein